MYQTVNKREANITDTQNSNYCDQTCYLLAFWTITTIWIVISLFCSLCFICCLFFIVMNRRNNNNVNRNENGNVEAVIVNGVNSNNNNN